MLQLLLRLIQQSFTVVSIVRTAHPFLLLSVSRVLPTSIVHPLKERSESQTESTELIVQTMPGLSARPG